MTLHLRTAHLERPGDRRCGRQTTAVLIALMLLATGVSPLLPRAAFAASTGAFQSTANPGGGTIVTGTLGNASLPAAVAALMRRVHAQLGTRPTIVQVAQNARDHSVALMFTAARNGRPYTGIAIVTAAPRAQAGGAALYDTSARFHTTIGPMMRTLNAMTNPAAASKGRAVSIALAPAEPLITHPFSDGTGSIGVPGDWTVKVANGGSALVNGPGGTVVAYNMDFSAMDMSNPRAQYFMRSEPPQLREQILHRTALLPYTGDPVKTWVTIFDQLTKQQGGSFRTQFHVTSATSAGPGIADIVGTGRGSMHFIAHVFLLPPNPNGMWTMSGSFIFLPDKLIARQGATATAVLSSVRINFGAIAAQNAAIRQTFQKKFEAMIAVDRAQDAARQERTDAFLANDRAAQEGMHKQAVAMENYSLDRAVVVDTRNGAHSTVGSGFADDLVRNNPNYQKVAAPDLLRGVDY